ncbi:MAG: 16S rRNA (adenine(1518)-N(6)/adenine(1519)-N(6))-dimethyltransferase RsmA [Treponema sp.]|nr:16S rRNA (adenine(1518)-N(6)/adenine(1519)-N(6))-dimethyltransferase RsmA [Treponema sp.]
MQCPDYNSASALKTFMEEHGMAMQKKFGQNFLVNGDARKRLIDALEIDEKSIVWEVGPGLGSMTSEILGRGSKLTVFEIDHGFAACIREFFEKENEEGRFKLVEGDVLKTWKKEYEENGQTQRFFGNLPYNVAATIIADTISAGVRFDKAVFTVQKEVAERMCAKPGTENYSSFSVLCQWAYDVKPLLDLAGGNFWPKPNVASRAVTMVKKQNFPLCENPDVFMKMQRALFAARRKTVKNNLTNFLSNSEKAQEALKNSGIDEKSRAEALSIEQLLKLSDAVYNVMK